MLMLFCGHCSLWTLFFKDKNKTKRVQQQIPFSSVDSQQNPRLNHSDKELSDQCRICCCPPLINCLAAIVDNEQVLVQVRKNEASHTFKLLIFIARQHE